MTPEPKPLLHIVAEALQKTMAAQIEIAKRQDALQDQITTLIQGQETLNAQQADLAAQQKKLSTESEAVPYLMVDQLTELGNQLSAAMTRPEARPYPRDPYVQEETVE